MKKWSYVAAAMLTAASGLALTSCIDNDEPFGIEQIRLATANLLNAKKAAVEAEAAAKSAQVEIAKINAEIEKLRIENEKIMAQANADYRAAEAKYLEALAEAERLKAEGQKAIDEATASKLLAEAAAKEKEADYWQAQADAIRQDAQGRYDQICQEIAERQQVAANAQREADRLYAEAVYNFEKDKANNANGWNKGLWAQVSDAFAMYLWSIDEYNYANKKYMTALNSMAAFEADLFWREKGEEVTEYDYVYDEETGLTKVEVKYTVPESGWYSPKYERKKALLKLIADQEECIATCEENVDILEGYKADLEKLNATYDAEKKAFDENELYNLLLQYQTNMETAYQNVQQAHLEKELLKEQHGVIFTAPAEKYGEYNAFMNQPVEFDGYEIPVINVLAALNPNWIDPIPVVKKGSYNIENPVSSLDVNNPQLWNSEYDPKIPKPSSITSPAPFSGTPQVVEDAVNEYNLMIRDLRLAMLDENDVLWTTARLNEMKRQLTQGNSAYETAVEYWKLAKTVYNMGNSPEEKLSALEDYGEADLEAAIEAYNALGAKAAQLIEAKNNADAELIEANQAEQDAVTEYDPNGYVRTFMNAQMAFVAAIEQADEEFKDDIATADANYVKAKERIALTIKDLYHAYNLAVLDLQQLELNPYATEDDIIAAKAEVKRTEIAYKNYAIPAVGEDKKPSNGAAIAEQNAKTAQENAVKNAVLVKQGKVLQARENLTRAEKAYVAAGGQVSTADPNYAAIKEAMDNASAAAEAQIAADEALTKFFDEELTPAYNDLTAANDAQLEALGLPSWPNAGGIPTDSQQVSLTNGDEFVDAYHPLLVLNDKQVYVNARSFVTTTSYTLFGTLGQSYDRNFDPNAFIDPYVYETYDWESDEAILLPDVNVAILDEYIKKYFIYNGWDNYLTNPFKIAQFYDNNVFDFGLLGECAALQNNIKFAEYITAEGSNNPISQQIEKMTDAREGLLNQLDKAQDDAKTYWNAYVEAYEEMSDLTAQAEANIDKFKDLYNLYKGIIENPVTTQEGDIVVSLKTWVDQLRDAALGGTETEIDNLVKRIEGAQKQVDSEKKKLADAKELLEKYQYQLGQYESDAFAKVENPYKFEVEYLAAEVKRLESLMEFWQQRYTELQQQYEAAKKDLNYPD